MSGSLYSQLFTETLLVLLSDCATLLVALVDTVLPAKLGSHTSSVFVANNLQFVAHYLSGDILSFSPRKTY